METKWAKWSEAIDTSRRKWLALLGAAGVLAVGARNTSAQPAQSTDNLHFPGESAAHKVVYQFNKPEAEYHQHVIFSVGAMLREYSDNIKIVVTVFGPGIHILLKHPHRPVTKEIREKVASLSQYGVEFHACGNTLTTLGLTQKDLLPFAKLVPIGAADLMELQKQGFAYISW